MGPLRQTGWRRQHALEPFCGARTYRRDQTLQTGCGSCSQYVSAALACDLQGDWEPDGEGIDLAQLPAVLRCGDSAAGWSCLYRMPRSTIKRAGAQVWLLSGKPARDRTTGLVDRPASNNWNLATPR